jgi:hypothetical protein
MGGDAWAARREGRSEFAWTAAFGRLEDLKRKYPKIETNETAKRLEELAKALGFDLAPVVRTAGAAPRPRPPAEERTAQTTSDYISAQICRSEASIDAPPEELTRFLEEKRGTLEGIESLVIAGPPPMWSFDISRPERDAPVPNGLGQLRLQRILLARALSAALGGRGDAAARSLEASWNLNESLRTRPETLSLLFAMAIARLQVGILREVSVDERLWRQRLTTLDPRRSLLDAHVLDARLNSSRNWWRDFFRNDGHSPWYKRARDLLASPMERVVMVEYSNLMRDELSRLRGSALSDPLPEPPTPARGSAAQIIASIWMPYIRNSFARVDRLVVDVELTSKILEAKQLRKENGMRWPAAIPGIETSRFPGASWRYEATPDGRMSIAFSRELASPYAQTGMKPLPLRFSSN